MPLRAGAVAPAATGWWWRPQAGLLGAMLPPPPGTDDDDLVVGSAPDGATALAAVRYELGPAQGRPILTLVAKSETNGDSARLAACPAQAAWMPAHAGRWDDKPTGLCDAGAIQGIRIPADDGTVTWTFPLEALLPPSGVIDVVFVPGTLDGLPQGAANGSSFQLVFDGPGPTALATTPRATTGQAPAPAPAPTVAPAPVAEPTPQPFVAALPPPTQPAAAPVGGAGGSTTAAGTTAPGRARQLQPTADEGRAGGRGEAVVVLVLAAALATLMARPPLLDALGLSRLRLVGAAPGGDAGSEAAGRGLGRFARPRSGPPPPL